MEQNLLSQSNKEGNIQKEKLSPKLDVVFQAIFGEVGSEKITSRFLGSILNEKISQIDLGKNLVLRREREDSKLGILDMIAQINGNENCNVEIQLVNQEDIIERMLYYWGRIYTRELKKGENYGNLKKTITVLIANFEIDKLRELDYHTSWKIIEENSRQVILTDRLELHIIMLPKVKENRKNQEEFRNFLNSLENQDLERGLGNMSKDKENEDELLDWLTFLIDPDSERVREKMKENEELKEAVEKLEAISEDENMRRVAELREKAIRDEIWFKESGRKMGIKEGRKEGLEQGKEQGLEEGKKIKNIENAKKMLEKKIPIETIMEITGLTKEEIMN
ncbi:MAG: Rpn family recombination-promoting nuclease/putative transposase [Clostridia bacterium]|nr:Rpn family recombination-promoting nuclease/putative transposase [Clostridia bacterium]